MLSKYRNLKPLSVAEERDRSKEIYNLHLKILVFLLSNKDYCEYVYKNFKEFISINNKKLKDRKNFSKGISEAYLLDFDSRMKIAKKIRYFDQDLNLLLLGKQFVKSGHLNDMIEDLISKRNKFIEHYYRYAYKLALKPRRMFDLDEDDRFQLSVIGLLKAIDKYDPTKKYRFLTYATYWINSLISRTGYNIGTLIRIPSHIAHNYKDVVDGVRLNNKSVDELGKFYGVRNSTILGIQTAFQRPISLDDYVFDEDGILIKDRLESNDVSVEAKIIFESDSKMLMNCINRLSDRDKFIINKRFFENETLEDISYTLEISRERVRQLEVEALNKMRKFIKKDSYGRYSERS